MAKERRYIIMQGESSYLEHFEFRRDGVRGAFKNAIGLAACVSSKEIAQHIAKCCLGDRLKVVSIVIDVPDYGRKLTGKEPTHAAEEG